MAALEWDDLRYVLAVAQAGSLAGAARELRVNHSTVLRRIAAFASALAGAVGPVGAAETAGAAR